MVPDETLLNLFYLMEWHHFWDSVLILIYRIDAHTIKNMRMRDNNEKTLCVRVWIQPNIFISSKYITAGDVFVGCGHFLHFLHNCNNLFLRYIYTLHNAWTTSKCLRNKNRNFGYTILVYHLCTSNLSFHQTTKN